jgi:hypothetical protein
MWTVPAEAVAPSAVARLRAAKSEDQGSCCGEKRLARRLLGELARGFVEPRLKFGETGLNLRRGGRNLLR